MTRIFVGGSVVAIAAISLLLVPTSSAAPRTVVGSVGPGFTISLKLDGRKVTKLKAGVPYRFTVADKSSAHDFHLSGPGVNRIITGVGYTGTKSIVVTLKKGAYRFVCDPHASSMQGSFQVS
jgi:plastocyanin